MFKDKRQRFQYLVTSNSSVFYSKKKTEYLILSFKKKKTERREFDFREKQPHFTVITQSRLFLFDIKIRRKNAIKMQEKIKHAKQTKL